MKAWIGKRSWISLYLPWRQNTSLIKDSIHDLESFSLNNSEDLDRLADKTTILNAYEASCPIVHRKVKKDVPW
jgi:hypothetical protein